MDTMLQIQVLMSPWEDPQHQTESHPQMCEGREGRDPIGNFFLGIVYESETPHMGSEIRVQ